MESSTREKSKGHTKENITAMACTVNHKTLATGEANRLGMPITSNEKANSPEVSVTVGDTIAHGSCDNACSTCEDVDGY